MAAAGAAEDARVGECQGASTRLFGWLPSVHIEADLDVPVIASQAEVASLQSQLGSLRRSPNPNASPNPNSPRLPGSPSSESALLARLRTAESSVSTLQRRLTATQAQLHDAEQRLGEQRSKYGVAEGKWEARVRELEQRVRNAEEKVKRERQGAKERVGELEAEARCVPRVAFFRVRALLNDSLFSFSTDASARTSRTPHGGRSSSTV